jgi:hypothetical protein
VFKVGVPIFNESTNKEEPPTNLVGEKKVEIGNDNNVQDTHSDKEYTFETNSEQDRGPPGGQELEVPFPRIQGGNTGVEDT